MLMKPGPAASALSTSSNSASIGAISPASARGLVPARLASTIAALVARSPCEGSRGGSTATALRSIPGGSCPSPSNRSRMLSICAAKRA
jgi:hypothetical protein